MNSWESVSLGGLLTRVKDQVLIQDFESYQRLTIHLNNKGISIRDEIDGHQIGTKNQFVVREGQFLLSKIDAMNGAFGIVPSGVTKGIITGNFWAYDVDEKRLHPTYFNYLTHTLTFQDFCIRASSGTTHRKYLQEEVFLAMKIPLPSQEEQRRIVGRIEALAERVREALSLRERAVEEAGQLIGKIIQDIFEHPKPGWEQTSLGKITLDVRYGTSEKAFDTTIGLPVLRMGNIQSGNLSLSDLKYTQLSSSDVEKLLLQKGDILVNRTNSAELVGKCAVFEEEGKYVYASYLIRVRLDERKAIPKLISAYINSPIGRQYMFKERKQMTGQANVNSRKLMSLPVLLPPLDEQRRIVAHLDAIQAKVDELRRLQAEMQQELRALLPAILDRAFKGEL